MDFFPCSSRSLTEKNGYALNGLQDARKILQATMVFFALIITPVSNIKSL